SWRFLHVHCGTLSSGAGLGGPPAAPTLLASRVVAAADLLHHARGRRSHAVQLHEQSAGVLAGRRHALLLSGFLGVFPALPLAAGTSVLLHPDADPAGARDGSLSLLQALRCVRNLAILYSGSHSDRNSRGVHPYPFAHPLPHRALRYRHCGSDCRLRRCRRRAVRVTGSLEAARRRVRAIGHSIWISAHISLGPPSARHHRSRAQYRGLAVEPRIPAPCRCGSLGWNVCHRVELAPRRSIGWRAHHLLYSPARTSHHLTRDHPDPDSAG